MVMTKTIPEAATMPNPSLSASEISFLLDIVEEAAFLIMSPNNQIIAVNAKATELTAYTRVELAGRQFSQIASYGHQTGERLSTRNFKKQPPVVKIINRHNKKTLCYAITTPITAEYRLITLRPAQGSVKFKSTSHSGEAYQKIYEMIMVSMELENNRAIDKILKIGCELIEAETLALFIGNGPNPSFRKIANFGNDKLLPAELSPRELAHFTKETLWTNTQRSIVTVLHQSARSSGYSFLATCPLGESNALIGILFAGGFQEPIPSHVQDRLKTIATMVNGVIKRNTLVKKLEQLRNERILIKSSFEATKESIDDGCIWVCKDFNIQEINKSAELILGFRNQDVQNLPIGDILVGSDRIIPALDLAFQGGHMPNLGEIVLLRRDGSEFPAEVSVAPISHKNQILGGLIILGDKSKDEQNRVHTQQLEQRALLGEVTSVFAHEVRNPINNISTGLQLLTENLTDDPENEDLLNRMQQDCHRLTDLMESVLTFSRSGNYNYRPIPIAHLIERLVRLWKPRMERLNIKPILKIESRNCQVKGDRRALDQVFTNVISNAIEAMKNSQGGILAIRIVQPEPQNGKEIIRIDISDSGPGIPAENRQKIFDPFFTTRKNGTGLGLSITKQIVTAHRGLINLTSFPGGTIFHITLPATNDLETTS
jgi:two-component system, NtrC family, sensor histidine kinase AtoS